MKTIVLTGATGGIGIELLKTLLEQNNTVLAFATSQEKANRVKQTLLLDYPQSKFIFFIGDLSSQQEVKRLANEVKQHLLDHAIFKIDVLINHAGSVFPKFQESVDGIEMQFALNHLSAVQLSLELRPFLRGGMILFTGSVSHFKAKIHWSNLEFRKGIYRIFTCYRQSKLANAMMAMVFRKEFQKDQIQTYVVDPGLVQTNIGTKHLKGLARLVWLWVKRRGVEASAVTVIYDRIIRTRPNGFYYTLDGEKAPNPIVFNEEACKRLYEDAKSRIHYD